MDESGADLVNRQHEEAVRREREEKDRAREEVEAMFRAALERQRAQQKEMKALVERLHRTATEQSRTEGPVPEEPATIPSTDLPPPQPDSPLRDEWNFYWREVVRWLSDGHEGRFVLIKGEQLVGIWDTCDEARAVALERYLRQPCLIHQIRSREPLLHLSARLRRWQS
jgi:hypothetical protein